MSDGPLEARFADWLAPFLLLPLREGDSYGHELTRKMTDLSFEDTRPGVVYRALWEIEEEGVVVSEYDGSDRGISRRRYSITEPGEAYLERWADALTRHQGEIDLFFKTYSEAHGQETNR